MYDPLYHYSLCAGSYLHRYQIKRTYPDVVEEVCEICKDIQYFKENTPNREYLDYHIRESLQPNRLIFHHEYKK